MSEEKIEVLVKSGYELKRITLMPSSEIISSPPVSEISNLSIVIIINTQNGSLRTSVGPTTTVNDIVIALNKDSISWGIFKVDDTWLLPARFIMEMVIAGEIVYLKELKF